MKRQWPTYSDTDNNFVYALPIKSIRQTVDGYAYASFDGDFDEQYLSPQFMTIFRPVVGGYLFTSASGELLYMSKTKFEAQYSAQTTGLQIGTTAITAMAGNKVPTTTQRGGVLQQAAEAMASE
ncbi:Decoration protein [Pantoea agglomerans]|nr:Decoration protein [Pantoea agglomerans]WIL41246.1 Decoration protein [Pantoea agglomerans]